MDKLLDLPSFVTVLLRLARPVGDLVERVFRIAYGIADYVHGFDHRLIDPFDPGSRASGEDETTGVGARRFADANSGFIGDFDSNDTQSAQKFKSRLDRFLIFRRSKSAWQWRKLSLADHCFREEGRVVFLWNMNAPDCHSFSMAVQTCAQPAAR
ncbi:MAG: hypothetical protein HYZ36_06215 [Pedosphaera parvula]|nr:hypothetical protein [Pedosphaera parvula]